VRGLSDSQLTLRHPGQAHALNGAFAPGKKGRVIAVTLPWFRNPTRSQTWSSRRPGRP